MSFRHWCSQKWYEHCDEVTQFTGRSPLYDSAEYFRMYKWWLKREYRHEMKGDQ